MFKSVVLLSTALIVGLLLVTASRAATTKCGVRSEIIQLLEAQYEEGRLAIALSQKSTEAFEVFVSQKGTWTVMRTSTNGQTCIMAAGHSWRTVDEKVGGQES